jgi:hypothetical protein
MEFTKTNHPQINSVLSLYEKEVQPFRKIHRLIDLFETIIKTHTVYVISDYIRNHHPSDEINRFLAKGLKTPSLGLWHEFSRVISHEMAMGLFSKEEYEAIYSEIPSERNKKLFTESYINKNGMYYLHNRRNYRKLRENVIPNQYLANRFWISNFFNEFIQWDDDSVSKVIHLRNYYAHGSTPEDLDCINHIKEFEPILEKWLSLEWLHETTILIFENNNKLPIDHPSATNSLINYETQTISFENYSPYLIDGNGKTLNLFPILYSKQIDGETNLYSLMFFNDLKRKQNVSFLNYPFSFHYRDKCIYQSFLEVINIEQWIGNLTPEFENRINELTESFKGRLKELSFINQFSAEKENGTLFIFGNPGVGKSAIIAKATEQNNEQHTIKYFCRRGTIYSQQDFFVDYLNRQLDLIYLSGIPLGNTFEEKIEFMHQRLKYLSDRITKKIIIMIDGVDEFTFANGDNLFSPFYSEKYVNILIIFTGRYTPETEHLYQSIPVEYKNKLELQGLEQKDIRALLYEVVNKYELEDKFVDEIDKKSQGNPLYLKLLCEELATSKRRVNDTITLPSKIEEFYDSLLHRYKRLDHNNLLLNTLFILGVSQDFVSQKQIASILKVGTAEAANAISALQEVLVESEEMDKEYQLFHESLREYLYQQMKNEMIDAENLLVEFCKEWKSHLRFDGSMKTYALRFYSQHLFNVGMWDRLLELGTNKSFIEMQIKVTEQFSSTFLLLKQCLTKIRLGGNKGILPQVLLNSTNVHYRLLNSYDEIVRWGQQKEEKYLKKALIRSELYPDEEKLVIYTLLYMYRFVNKDNINHLTNQLRVIDKHMKENITKVDSPEFYIPKAYVNRLEPFLQDSTHEKVNWLSYAERLQWPFKKSTTNERKEMPSRFEKEINDLLEGHENVEAKHLPDFENDKLQDVYFKKLTEQFIKKNKFEQYKHFVFSIQEKNQRNWEIEELCYHFALHGLENEAVDLIEQLDDQWNQASALRKVSTVLASKGKIEEALQLIQTIANLFHRNEGTFEVVRELIKMNAPSQGMNFLSLVTNPLRQQELIHLISIKYVQEEEVEKALELVSTVKNENKKSEILSEIIKILCKKESLAVALNVCSLVTKHMDKVWGLLKILSRSFDIQQDIIDNNALVLTVKELLEEYKFFEETDMHQSFVEKWISILIKANEKHQLYQTMEKFHLQLDKKLIISSLTAIVQIGWDDELKSLFTNQSRLEQAKIWYEVGIAVNEKRYMAWAYELLLEEGNSTNFREKLEQASLLTNVSTQLFIMGDFEFGQSALLELIYRMNGLSKLKNEYLLNITNSLIDQNKINESIKVYEYLLQNKNFYEETNFSRFIFSLFKNVGKRLMKEKKSLKPIMEFILADTRIAKSEMTVESILVDVGKELAEDGDFLEAEEISTQYLQREKSKEDLKNHIDFFKISRDVMIEGFNPGEDNHSLDLEEFWGSVLSSIYPKISKQSYDTWFKNTIAYKVVDDTIIVLTNNEFQTDWLTERYEKMIEKTIQEMYNEPFQVTFTHEILTPENLDRRLNLTRKNALPLSVVKTNQDLSILMECLKSNEYFFETKQLVTYIREYVTTNLNELNRSLMCEFINSLMPRAAITVQVEMIHLLKGYGRYDQVDEYLSLFLRGIGTIREKINAVIHLTTDLFWFKCLLTFIEDFSKEKKSNESDFYLEIIFQSLSMEEEQFHQLLTTIVTQNIENRDVVGMSLYAYGFWLLYFQSDKSNDEVSQEIIEEIDLYFPIPNLKGNEMANFPYEKLSDWIDLISDENDLEDIKSWAKRVENNKMTKEKFEENVKRALSL